MMNITMKTSASCVKRAYYTTTHHYRRLTIRGKDSDDAVICTKTRTYSLLTAQTSNNLLVTPTLKSVGEVELLDEAISYNKVASD